MGYIMLMLLVFTYLIDVGLSATRPIQVIKQEMTWDNANQYCYDNFGTELATIKNAQENQLIIDEVGLQKTVWIGMNDRVVEGPLGWIDGYNVPGMYTNWEDGEPVKDILRDDIIIYLLFITIIHSRMITSLVKTVVVFGVDMVVDGMIIHVQELNGLHVILILMYVMVASLVILLMVCIFIYIIWI